MNRENATDLRWGVGTESGWPVWTTAHSLKPPSRNAAIECWHIEMELSVPRFGDGGLNG